jgi:hypothetical protein
MALNGGPQYAFTHAISLFVSCETQSGHRPPVDEVPRRRRAPEPVRVAQGQVGLSWQIIPRPGQPAERRRRRGAGGRVWNAMLQMDKLDVASCSRRTTEPLKRKRAQAERSSDEVHADDERPGRRPYQIGSWPKKDIQAHIGS